MVAQTRVRGDGPGNHIAARAQEFILGEASRLDARVSLLEAVHVKLAIHLGRGLTVPQSQHSIREVGARVSNAAAGDLDWAQLDQFQVDDLFLHSIPMLKSCPHFLRGRLRDCFQVALRERYLAKLRGDEAGQVRGWKLFALVPMMMLHRPQGSGSVGRSELVHRADRFAAGRWAELVHDATQHHQSERSEEDECERRGKAAQARVQRGQVSRARQELVGAKLALKDQTTLNELRGRRPQEQLREIPADVMSFEPETPVQLDRKIFATCLRVSIRFIARAGWM